MLALINKFRKLNKNVRIIILLLFISIVLSISTSMLKNASTKENNIWNYDKIKSARFLIHKGKYVTDRKIYWDLKQIISKFISTEAIDFLEENDQSEKIDYLEYYDVLEKEYKKHLNKDEFAVLAKDFINRFLGEDHIGNKYVDKFIISDIYRYDQNRFLCLLQNEDDDTDNVSYIGIELNEKDLKFSIFYIE